MGLKKIELGITGFCNLRCRHCSAAEYNCSGRRDFTLLEIRKILNEAKQLGARRVEFTGGEPLVRADLRHIVALAKEIGFEVKLLSNGTLLNESKLKELKTAGLDGLAISLDGASHEVHTRTRQTTKAEFDIAVAAIQKAAELGMAVKINTAASAANLADIPNIAKLASRLGCYEHRICLFIPTGRGRYWTGNTLNDTVWTQFIREELSDLDCGIKIYVAAIKLPGTVLIAQAEECLLDSPSFLGIAPDGKAFACAFLAFHGIFSGDIRKNRLAEIWTDKNAWEKVRQSVKQFCCGGERENGFIFVCPCRKIDARAFGAAKDALP